MKDLSKHYGTLNAHERLLLSLEATARQDEIKSKVVYGRSVA